MSTKGIQAHQVADAFNAVPGSYVKVTAGQPASTIAINASNVQIIPPSGGGITFVVPVAGLYKVDLTLEVNTSSGSSTAKFYLVFDEGEAYAQTVGAGVSPNDEWQFRCTVDDYAGPFFSDTVELTAGTHTLKGYATNVSGGTMQIIGSGTAPTQAPIVRLTMISGSGAGGTLVDKATGVVGGTNKTYSAASWTDVLLNDGGAAAEVSITAAEGEDVALLLSAYGYNPSGTDWCDFRVIRDGTDVVAGVRIKFHLTYLDKFIGTSFVDKAVAAGTHTYKFQVYCNASTNLTIVTNDADKPFQMSAVVFRGGLVPVESDGTSVVDTPRALNFIGANVTATSAKADIEVYRNALWLPPSSPHADDEEFNVAGSIPSPWLRGYNVSASAIDPYAKFSTGDPRDDVRNSWFLMQGVGNNTDTFLYRAYTFPTNLMVWSRMRFGHRALTSTANNDAVVCLAFSASLQGTSPDKPARVNAVELFLQESDAGTIQFQYQYFASGVPTTVSVGPDVDAGIGMMWSYAGIHKVGTTYHGWLWTDSGQSCYVGKISFPAFSPAYVYTMFQNNQTDDPGNTIVGVDFIRFAESATFFPVAG